MVPSSDACDLDVNFDFNLDADGPQKCQKASVKASLFCRSYRRQVKQNLSLDWAQFGARCQCLEPQRLQQLDFAFVDMQPA